MGGERGRKGCFDYYFYFFIIIIFFKMASLFCTFRSTAIQVWTLLDKLPSRRYIIHFIHRLRIRIIKFSIFR
jgi:hypothetical protein